MKQLSLLSLIATLLALLFSACEEDDKFSSDSSLKLEYSTDVLQFDTVFATIASPMQRMKIYNRNDNSITFSSISLLSPETSGFRINVTGQSGTSFENIDLLRKDSIFIIADIRVLNGKNKKIEDYLELKWNGNTQLIPLEAYILDVEIWEDDRTIDTDTYLTADKGYYIKGKVSVSPNATLSIQEGTTLYFDQKGSLDIAGKIVAKGTSEKRITFRGHRFDFIQQNVRYDNASGQWEGITIEENSFDNILENVNIRNSKVGINFIQSTTDKQKATLTNTIVHNTSEYGIKAINCKIDAINCQFSNSTGGLLTLIGGNYSFTHCTIANYYKWHPRLQSSVILTDKTGSETFPFSACTFENSIIAGIFKDELELFLTQKDNNSILFSNCIIQSSVALNDKWFENTTWNIESVFPFENLNIDKDYCYSFGLTEGSTAINAANKTVATNYPTDLRGISRLSDSGPDIGCYEWYPTKNED